MLISGSAWYGKHCAGTSYSLHASARVMHFRRLLFLACALTSLASAQQLSVGIKAGIPLTQALENTTFSDVVSTVRTSSDSGRYVVGPTVEIGLPLGIRVEADALYRPVNVTVQQASFGAAGRSSQDYSSWEFPILFKHRLGTPLVKPYVEAGPSFRWFGGGLNSNLSQKGFTVGGGVQVNLLKVRVAPELRYTRWGSDSGLFNTLGSFGRSQVNQVEFLVGFSI